MRLDTAFAPTAPQTHFLSSQADIRGYGGAMGGGKSRTICEEALNLALERPGIQILLARNEHTAIIETTKKTMMRYVLGPVDGLIARTKNSQGEDLIELTNGSQFNFIGLDKPGKWFSSEIGALIVDEAHECDEEDVVLLMSRLRQEGMQPYRVLIAFNPGNPGHWLQDWFIKGATQTEFGFYKPELYVTDAEGSAGSAEFVFANAYANPYLPRDYIDKRLKSMPKLMRQRMLEGLWVLQDGSLFFDSEALTEMAAQVRRPWKVGVTRGDCGYSKSDPIGVKVTADGPLAVWKPPVRDDEVKGTRAHRYVATCDPSSGGASDYTGIQVVDVDSFEQVAELQAKLDPDLAALELFRIGCIYNSALLAIETTGGFGQHVVKTVQRLQHEWKGPRASMPRLYMRRVEDRLSKKWTDVLGWDTNTKTRMAMLDALEEVVRERSFTVYGARTYEEMRSFAFTKTQTGKWGKPEAIRGKHDDLVMPLAIAVYLCVHNHVKRPVAVKEQRYQPAFGVTGY